jgi:AcrR family transcriptional regulator
MARAKKSATNAKKRLPLTAEGVIEAAVKLADRQGLDAVSMRGLAGALGVEAMSLYNHVRNKEQLFAGMTERIWAEVYLPRLHTTAWTSELRLRYLSAHTVVLAHPWIATLIESVRSGPVLLGSSNAVVGCLRGAGFPVHLAYRALLTLDSYLYGFCFQEVTWPHARSELPQVVSEMLPEVSVADFPHLVEMMEYVVVATAGSPAARGPLDYRAEFEFGLDLILQGLNRALTSEAPAQARVTSARQTKRSSP